MKIAFFEIRDWEAEMLKKRFKKHTLLFYSTPLTQDHIKDIEDCDIISVFIYSDVSSKILSRLPNLKLIITRSTGYDHIACKECGKRKITVCNIPYYGENTVAEHTFALLLSISRKIHKSYLKTMAGDFSIEELKGFDLKGKTIGVIGTGHIGAHVLRIASGFEMDIIAFDRHKHKDLQRKIKFKYVPLKTLIKKSDIITIHLPLSSETKHMINSKTISQMKKRVILINTSRGEIVDTHALLKALETGHVAGVGIDVIEGESLIKEERELLHKQTHAEMKKAADEFSLIRNDKVVFTPHIAFYSQEALERIIHTTMEEIESFIKNKPMNQVNR